MTDSSPAAVPIGRSRIAWWGILAALGVAVALFVWSFVGTFVLGLFFYYGLRPLHRRVTRHVSHRTVSATLALVLVLVPVLALLGYAGLVAGREFTTLVSADLARSVLDQFPGATEEFEAIVSDPSILLQRSEAVAYLREFLSAGFSSALVVGTALLHLSLAFSLTFFLLRDGPRAAGWFRSDVADEGGVAAAYLSAVDADLEAVYFGNVITVLLVGVLSWLVYNGFNLLAPPALQIPVPTLLALLTGLATFVPIVVGKLVYLPMAGYLALAARGTDGGVTYLWVAAFLLVSFLVLDLLPQTVVRPYLSGRTLHTGLVLFGYVLGAALFGWYGLFLGPLLVVLVVQAANVVLPELLRGERLTPATYISIGSEPTGASADPGEGPVSAGERSGPDPNGDGNGAESVDTENGDA